jgi:hypothetical protein
MMRTGRKDRRAIRQISKELRREDPLLASMLSAVSEEHDTEPGGRHPENAKRHRRAERPATYMPFVMF